MQHNDSTGNQTAGPMDPLDEHLIDCPDCDWSATRQGAWAAETAARSHAGETGHQLPEAYR